MADLQSVETPKTRISVDCMARIYPFRALRYNPSLVRLEDVVTQPYDKITPAMQQAYYQRSPYNLVRLILGLPELFDGTGNDDIYRRAAHDFTVWRNDSVLSQESEPCVFAYSQCFAVPGQDTLLERRGLIALGQLYDYSANVIFRHEQTLAKPKSDRLNLLRATQANFGQIFMLYSDPGKTVERLLFSSETAPDMEVTDEYSVVHRVWKVSDPATLNLLTAALEDKKLIIADGHHRYETALTYAREQAPDQTEIPDERVPGPQSQPPYPEAAAMMTFVNMESPGLVILPTHRVVYGLKNFQPQDFFTRAQAFFEIELLPEAEISDQLSRLNAETGTAFVAATAAGSHLLRTKPEAVAQVLSQASPRQRSLDPVQLQALVFENLLGLTAEDIRQQAHLRYLRDASEAAEQVVTGEANAAFLMKPVTLDQLREVAFAGEVMPQKSTDFYPKLLSGLTIYALD